MFASAAYKYVGTKILSKVTAYNRGWPLEKLLNSDETYLTEQTDQIGPSLHVTFRARFQL